MAFLTTPKEVLASNITIVTICSLLHILVRKHGAPPSARKAMHYHNRIQVLLSLNLVGTTIGCYLPPSTTHHPLASSLRSNSCRTPRYLYHFSKFYEYLDILLLIAQGSSEQIGLHFAFHHLTTPWYTTFRVLRDYGGWGLFAGLNAFHHLLMHAYFGGAGWTKPVLTYTRNVQLIVGILWDVYIVLAVRGSTESTFGNWVSIGLLSCYLILHRRDVRMITEKKED